MNPWKEVTLHMRGIHQGRVIQYELPALILSIDVKFIQL